MDILSLSSKIIVPFLFKIVWYLYKQSYFKPWTLGYNILHKTLSCKKATRTVNATSGLHKQTILKVINLFSYAIAILRPGRGTILPRPVAVAAGH